MTAEIMKVLMVDDDPIFLDFLESELNEIGTYHITRAESAAQAIDIVLSTPKPFDCFLLDIDMPGMNGIELCSVLRGQPSAAGVPIVMVTRLREIEMMDQAFAAGATDYLNKPLVPAELRGRLQMAEAKLREKEARLTLMQAVVTDAPLKIGDPMRPDGVPCCVDHVAMENYAFRIGSEELCRRTILGLHVSNIAELFEHKDALGFKLMLTELAQMIVEAFGFDQMMLSYAGNGQFLVLLGERVDLDLEQIATTLRSLLQLHASRGLAVGEMMPQLKLGLPVSPTLFACAAPDEVLLIAMGIAMETGMDISSASWPSLLQFSAGDFAAPKAAPVIN